MKKNQPQSALAALGARLAGDKGDLTQARDAAEKVLRNLPTPSLCDHMLLPKDLPVPCVPMVKPSLNPPLIETPRAFFDSFGLLDPILLPDSMMAAYLEHEPRRHRAWWFRQLHPECVRALQQGDLLELTRLDGVVAGLLFLTLQPPIGSRLREGLFRRIAAHKFGALMAARGMLLAEEHLAILMLLGSDSRYLRWLSQLGWETECPAYCARQLNLEAGMIMLPTPLGQVWLEKLVQRAGDEPEAAAAALVLQPEAPERLRNLWTDTVVKAKAGRVACLAARYARHTWPQPEWRQIRERLRAAATDDKGPCWCYFHSQISDSEEARTALGDPQADVLWALELLHATQAPDTSLRHLLGERLATDPGDQESIVALDWLDLRQQRRS
jgi:hypothetical protein